jgi:hypothetical protein
MMVSFEADRKRPVKSRFLAFARAHARLFAGTGARRFTRSPVRLFAYRWRLKN